MYLCHFQIFRNDNIGVTADNIKSLRLNRDDREVPVWFPKPVDTEKETTYFIFMRVAAGGK